MQFPCGWCLNCRVDKRNSLTHRCEKEFIDKKCGAFVTFTYDNPHIIPHLRRNAKGELVATLSKLDAKRFLDRLNKLVHSQPDTLLCNHKYKYLIVGEYGGNGSLFDRPHFHVLFFGLDFALCKKLFLRAWQGKGQIDIGNIGNGAIGYVTKYLDKQIFGGLARRTYDDNNLERPFCHHSLGLGASLYVENLDYARNPEHLGVYRWKGRDVPFPAYYKNKFLLRRDGSVSFKKQLDDFFRHNDRMPKNLYEIRDFKLDKAKLRERILQRKLFDSGSPFLDVNTIETVFRPDWHKKQWKAYKYDKSRLIRQLDLDIPF